MRHAFMRAPAVWLLRLLLAAESSDGICIIPDSYSQSIWACLAVKSMISGRELSDSAKTMPRSVHDSYIVDYIEDIMSAFMAIEFKIV